MTKYKIIFVFMKLIYILFYIRIWSNNFFKPNLDPHRFLCLYPDPNQYDAETSNHLYGFRFYLPPLHCPKSNQNILDIAWNVEENEILH